MDELSSPAAHRHEKSVRELLVAMLNETAPDHVSTPFRQVLGRLIEQAAAGERHAMKEIFDRVDGTPKPQADVKAETQPVLLNTGINWRPLE